MIVSSCPYFPIVRNVMNRYYHTAFANNAVPIGERPLLRLKSRSMNIAVDAMGGDFAPEVVVQGALRAADELGMEITLKSYFKGYEITEVPTTWRDRSSGQSRFRLMRWLPKYMRWYLFALKNSLLTRQ